MKRGIRSVASLRRLSTCHLCCAWIAKDGTSYHLSDRPGEGSHGGVAETVLGDHTRGRGLDEQGFLHLSYGGPFMGSRTEQPTQAQLDRLFDIQVALEARKAGQARYIASYLAAQAEKDLAS